MPFRILFHSRARVRDDAPLRTGRPIVKPLESHQVAPLIQKLMTDYRDRIPANARVLDLRNTATQDSQPSLMQAYGWHVTTTQAAPDRLPAAPATVCVNGKQLSRPGSLTFKQGRWDDPGLAAAQSMDLVLIDNEGMQAMDNEQLQLTIDNAQRMLKPGGYLCLRCSGQFDDRVAPRSDSPSRSRKPMPTLASISDMVARSGLNIQESNNSLWEPDNHRTEFRHVLNVVARKPMPLPQRSIRHRLGLHSVSALGKDFLNLWPTVHLDVPYSSQSNAEDPHGCWYYCLKMVRGARQADENEFSDYAHLGNDERHFALQRWAHLEVAVREQLGIDYHWRRMTVVGINKILKQHGPIIFSWKENYQPGSFIALTHMSVVVGTERKNGQDWVIYHDPARTANMRMKLEKFNDWRRLDTGAMMMYPVDEEFDQELKLGPGEIDRKDCRDFTQLMFYASVHNNRYVEALIANHANLNIQNGQGYNALMLAVNVQSTACIDTLIAAGADLDMVTCTGRTALSMAATHDDAAITRQLLNAGAEIDLVDRWGWSATMHAARWGKTASLQALLERKPNLGLRASLGPTQESPPGATALHLAAEYGWLESVALLTKAGADRNAKDDNGQTAAMKAEQYEQQRVVDALNGPECVFDLAQV